MAARKAPWTKEAVCCDCLRRAVSLFDHSKEHLGDNRDPNRNRFIREPGHVEYASKLGLGVFDDAKIKLKAIEL